MSESTTLRELKLAQQELILHHKDLENCANELRMTNKCLKAEKLENGKREEQLNIDLEEMMFTVSHKVRKSVANILGISILLQTDESLGIEEWKEMLDIIIKSAQSLNVATEELSNFIHITKYGETNIE